MKQVVIPQRLVHVGRDADVGLEMAGVRYVGAGVLSSAVGTDKPFMKQLFLAAGLPVLPYVLVRPRQWEHDPANTAPPGGETANDFAARVKTTLEEIVAEYKGRSIVVGAHAGTNRGVLVISAPEEKNLGLEPGDVIATGTPWPMGVGVTPSASTTS